MPAPASTPAAARDDDERPPSILLVEDHSLYREALAQVIERTLGGTLAVRTAASAEEGLRLSALLPFRLILLDIELPGMSGLEAIEKFRQALPEAAIVMLSGSNRRLDVTAAVRLGAQGFASKSMTPPMLGDIVRRALRCRPAGCEVRLGTLAPQLHAARDDDLQLSARQRQILALVASGHSNKEIGWRLRLAEITVKQHVSAILRRLGVRNRTQAVIAARELGLATMLVEA